MNARDAGRSRIMPPVVGILSLVAIAAIVEALLRADLLNRFILPLPSQIALAFERIIVEENVLARFVATTTEAVVAGALVHRVRILRAACETWVAALAAAPIVLCYPLFLVTFGRSATTIVMMGFVAALPPVILKTIEGLAATKRVLIDVGRSFNGTASQLFWKIMLPSALPTIFVGLRLGLIFALINIVGVEFLINFGGLGQLINELAERYDLPGTYASICFVILVSVFFFMFTERVERWLRPVN